MAPNFFDKTAKTMMDFGNIFQKIYVFRLKMVSTLTILKNFDHITIKSSFHPFFDHNENFGKFDYPNPQNITFHCIFKKQIFAACVVLQVALFYSSNFVLLGPLRGRTPPQSIFCSYVNGGSYENGPNRDVFLLTKTTKVTKNQFLS